MTDLLLEVMTLLREHEEMPPQCDEAEAQLIRAGVAGRIIARVVEHERRQNASLASLQEPKQ